MSGFLFMGVQEDPEMDVIEARGVVRVYDGTKRTKRDEWSCPCCGVPTDSHYCEPCVKAECGEQDVDAPERCLAKETKP